MGEWRVTSIARAQRTACMWNTWGSVAPTASLIELCSWMAIGESPPSHGRCQYDTPAEHQTEISSMPRQPLRKRKSDGSAPACEPAKGAQQSMTTQLAYGWLVPLNTFAHVFQDSCLDRLRVGHQMAAVCVCLRYRAVSGNSAEPAPCFELLCRGCGCKAGRADSTTCTGHGVAKRRQQKSRPGRAQALT